MDGVIKIKKMGMVVICLETIKNNALQLNEKRYNV